MQSMNEILENKFGNDLILGENQSWLEAFYKKHEQLLEENPCKELPSPSAPMRMTGNLAYDSEGFWKAMQRQCGFGEIFLHETSKHVTTQQKKYRELFLNYCRKIECYIDGEKRGMGILFTGPTGTMKSTALWILAKAIVTQYHNLKRPTPFMRYITFYEAMTQIHADHYGRFKVGIEDYLATVEVLFLDDVAPFGITAEEQKALLALCDYRWRERKIMFMASNQNEGWFERNLPQVYDRFKTGHIFNFSGASTREAKG